MYILNKIYNKNISLNKFIMFIKNIINKNDSKKECFIEVNSKENRLESIKNKLNEIEYSILSYNQYKEVYKDNVIRININELEKVYKNISE